ncbi:unnamed protein product [Miscanthus lutarioriparius]|uniref:Plant bHLH transcription factor ACT-like domain-containing protein n=1 Tax=Miscanthus lutarioriparius TaxID=422564 RepID=A0A811NBK3_9POAL|nr:unnamed protein product [Miscanthus lutarioriparius]
MDPTHKLVYVHQVTVETLAGPGQHGFVINVLSDESCPGLLVSILEAFDEMGLSLLPATGEMQNQVDNVDEHVVKQAVLQAIRTCSSQGCRQQQE